MKSQHKRAALREALVFAFFVLAAIALTWPLVRNFSRAIPDVGDPYVSISVFDWNVWATFHEPGNLFHQPIFHPARYALAFTEHLYGIALLVVPAYWLGLSSVAAYNISLILGYAFCGYGGYVLSRTVTRNVPASIAGGVFFAFMPWRITQLPHISYIWSGWLPLMFAALITYARRPNWKWAWLFAAAFFLNGITCLHWLAMGSFAAALSALLLWGVYRHDAKFPLRIAVSGSVASAALLPFLLPYQRVGELYGMKRSIGEAEMFSARITDWFVGGPHLPYAQFLDFPYVNPERWLFTGFVPLAMAVAAMFLLRRDGLPVEVLKHASPPRVPLWALRGAEIVAVVAAIAMVFPAFRRDGLAPAILVGAILVRWFLGSFFERVRESRFSPAVLVAIVLVIIGVIGSLGLNTFFHSFLFEYVRPFRSIRVSARWAILAYLGLTILVSCGVLTLSRRRIVAPAVVLVMLIEFNPAPFRWYLAPIETPEVYRWLRTAPVRGAILELPLVTGNSEYEYLFRARDHGRPMLNGVSSFIPPHFERLAEMAHAQPITDRFTETLERYGCAFIVVHADRLAAHDRTTREWLRRSIESGRLSFVRRFAHHTRGDYVFAVNRIAPNSSFLREAERRDGSGAFPSDHLRRFLESNAYTFFGAPIGWVDQPIPHVAVRGELTVSGWAAAPGGVERVRLHFAGDTVVEDAELFNRPELWPDTIGYPAEFATGFRRSFRYRPPWTRDLADVIVEVIGRDGRSIRMEPVFFTWRDRLDIAPQDWNPEALQALQRRLGILRIGSSDVPSVREITDALVDASVHDDDTRFVLRCYRALLNRGAEKIAVDEHLASLRAGKTRREVVRSFLRSGEFQKVHLR